MSTASSRTRTAREGRVRVRVAFAGNREAVIYLRQRAVCMNQGCNKIGRSPKGLRMRIRCFLENNGFSFTSN